MKLDRKANKRTRDQFAQAFGMDQRYVFVVCPECFGGNLTGTMTCPVNKPPQHYGKWTADILCVDCDKLWSKKSVLLIAFDEECPCDDEGRLVSFLGDRYVNCPCHGKNHFLP